jgi:putative acetyltransferase
VNIRAADQDDLPAICDIHKMAFCFSEMGHNGEAELVRALHDDADVLCSLVAEVDGKPIGHVLFSRMSVEGDRQNVRAAGLAPVSVLPDSQRIGIGAALISAGLKQLKAEGFQVSFVLGHSSYYSRFGYRAELAAPYKSPFAGPHFMAVHLDSGLALPQRGTAEYAPAFARMG